MSSFRIFKICILATLISFALTILFDCLISFFDPANHDFNNIEILWTFFICFVISVVNCGYCYINIKGMFLNYIVRVLTIFIIVVISQYIFFPKWYSLQTYFIIFCFSVII